MESPTHSLIPEHYRKGELVRGRVVAIRHFGAFVEVEPRVVGLILVTDMSLEGGTLPEDVLKVGEEVNARIRFIAQDRQKMRLALEPRRRKAQSNDHDSARD